MYDLSKVMAYLTWLSIKGISQHLVKEPLCDVSKLPNEAATTSETTLLTAAGKVRTYHHPLQVLNIAIHMYPALQLT